MLIAIDSNTLDERKLMNLSIDRAVEELGSVFQISLPICRIHEEKTQKRKGFGGYSLYLTDTTSRLFNVFNG